MLIFTDIDDTLMKTKRKINNIENLSIGAYAESGEALSYIEPERKDFIHNFLEKHTVIPVTARSYSALTRVELVFKQEKIINFGAHILNENNILLSDWQEIINQQQVLNDIINKVDFIENHFTIPEYVKLIKRIEFENFIFFNFRNTHLNLEENITFAKKLTDFLNNNNINDFYLYITDRDVTMIPSYIKKERAVEFLLKKYQNITSIGIGDHKNDYSFMHLCDFSIFPNDSSLAKLIKELP